MARYFPSSDTLAGWFRRLEPTKKKSSSPEAISQRAGAIYSHRQKALAIQQEYKLCAILAVFDLARENVISISTYRIPKNSLARSSCLHIFAIPRKRYTHHQTLLLLVY